MYSQLRDAYPQYDAQGTLLTEDDIMSHDQSQSSDTQINTDDKIKSEELKGTSIIDVKRHTHNKKPVIIHDCISYSQEKQNRDDAIIPMSHKQAIKNFIDYRYGVRNIDEKTIEHLGICDYCRKLIKSTLKQTNDPTEKIVEGFNISTLKQPVVKDTIAVALIGILTITLLDTFVDLYTSF